MSNISGIVSSLLLKQISSTTTTTTITSNSILESEFYNYNPSYNQINAPYITIHARQNIVQGSPNTDPENVNAGDYFFLVGEGNYLYKFEPEGGSFIITDTGTGYYMLGGGFYSVDTTGLLTPIINSDFIYFQNSHYVFVRTNENEYPVFPQTDATPPYEGSPPKLLVISNYDPETTYPTDINNNTLSKYNNNFVNIDSGNISIHTYNCLSDFNYYKNGTAPNIDSSHQISGSTNLKAGEMYVCLDRIVIRNVNNNGFYSISYNS
jgi:hypothetical protein